MSHWQNHSIDEQIAMIQSVAQEQNIEDNAVEKDWWVTVILKPCSILRVGDGFFSKVEPL